MAGLDLANFADECYLTPRENKKESAFQMMIVNQ